MENNSITKLILGFLVLIVGLALIGSVATETNAVTEKLSVSAEVIDISSDKTVAGACPMGVNGTNALAITNAPTGWKTSDCPISGFTMYNQTGVTATTVTDYVFYPANGTIMLKNTTLWSSLCTATSNTTTVAYTYCDDDYINIAWGRTVLNLVSGFFALALLMVSVALFYSVGKDTGIIN